MTPQTNPSKRQAFVTVASPAAVLVMATWVCMCLLHMSCQMAENKRVELAGGAGAFHSLRPDNAPSGVGELLASPDSPPTGEQTLTERLTGKNGMGWEFGNEWG